MTCKRLLPFLMIVSSLAGCAAETCRDHACSPDDRLNESVKAKLAEHPALLADHLRVRADNGVVYLYGLVATYVELAEAEDVAKATPGVTRVVNLCAIENMQR